MAAAGALIITKYGPISPRATFREIARSSYISTWFHFCFYFFFLFFIFKKKKPKIIIKKKSLCLHDGWASSPRRFQTPKRVSTARLLTKGSLVRARKSNRRGAYVSMEAFVRAARGKRSKYLMDNEFVKSINAVCISNCIWFLTFCANNNLH